MKTNWSYFSRRMPTIPVSVFWFLSSECARRASCPQPAHLFIPTLARLIFACIFLLSILLHTDSGFAANPFPRYPIIDNNVRFWESIYGRYSTSQAVVHDSDNLGIVYEVIPIFNYRLPGASKINRPIIKGIKKKYSRILGKLAKGISPHTTEEKRVAALFGKVSRKRLKKAADSVRVQIGQKDRFLEGVIRSGAYMPEIREIFKKQGLPEDLAYLPHVESSFNPKAYSKAGASGIWQFTRSTGKQFLTINYALDERQDPILSSHAAASFLKNNYKLLGSWPLALTAYNYGPSGMLRAKEAHLSYERIFSRYEKGHFKFASRNFYSEFL
ncbi:MAG TPA: lytic transglycosylase domain-containing protein, partial [Desulfocapsa sulfexigens]|nr:lytic transglycosylase domain-containing protein [Desulfocapsa sulfexigens]